MFPGSGFIPSSQFALCCNHQILVSSQYLAVSEDAPGGCLYPMAQYLKKTCVGCCGIGCAPQMVVNGMAKLWAHSCVMVLRKISLPVVLSWLFLQAAWSADLAFGPWIG